MKVRTINHIMACVTVLTNVLALIAVLSGQHTLFGTIAVSISMAVSAGMYMRVALSTAALMVSEDTDAKQEKLVEIAIAQKDDIHVLQNVAKWVRTGDREWMGARITDLVVASDKDGKRCGFWLLLIGTQSVYENILKAVNNAAAVLDYWPIDADKWADGMLETYMKPEWLEEEDDDAPIEELKG